MVRAQPLTKKVKSGDRNSNDRKLTCEICKRMFLRPSALKVHMRIHSGEKPFQCTYCPRAFSQSGNLTVHLRMHTGERPFKCTICQKGFSQSNSLQAHVRTHTGERPFQCKECYKRFADRYVIIVISYLVNNGLYSYPRYRGGNILQSILGGIGKMKRKVLTSMQCRRLLRERKLAL